MHTMTTLVHIDIGGVELDAEDTPPPRIVRSFEQSHSNGGYNRAALNVPCIAFQIWPRWHCWRLWPSRPPLPRMRGGASDGHHRWVKFLSVQRRNNLRPLAHPGLARQKVHCKQSYRPLIIFIKPFSQSAFFFLRAPHWIGGLGWGRE